LRTNILFNYGGYYALLSNVYSYNFRKLMFNDYITLSAIAIPHIERKKCTTNETN